MNTSTHFVQKHTRLYKKLSEEELAETWQRYRETKTIADRNKLIENYMPIVIYQAENIKMSITADQTVDDLLSYGIIGMIDALETFDLDRGLKFATFAAKRIRGEIWDTIRSMDWVPRLTRKRSKKVAEINDSFMATKGYRPTEEEVAVILKLPNKQANNFVQDSSPSVMMRMGGLTKVGKWSNSDEQSDAFCSAGINLVCDTPRSSRRRDDPSVELNTKETMDLIKSGLNRTERLIIDLYYLESLTMNEVGKAVGLTESRVCQIHQAVIQRLKHRLTIDKKLISSISPVMTYDRLVMKSVKEGGPIDPGFKRLRTRRHSNYKRRRDARPAESFAMAVSETTANAA